MDTQQAERLTMEAYALCDRLAARAIELGIAGDRERAIHTMTITRVAAVRRWGRRLDKWAVAAYGPAVQP